MVQYLFGFNGGKNFGLIHILLELKTSIFYSWKSNLEDDAFIETVKYNVKNLFIKWKAFVPIYNYMGPDTQT